jgi:ABC-type uncharacterized transport system permease subunit
MTLPGLLIAFLLATACGLAFHLVRGGSLARMAVYVFTAWVTFFTGHALAQAFGWTFGRLGSINLLAASVAVLLGLSAVSILARPEGKPHNQARKPPTADPPA